MLILISNKIYKYVQVQRESDCLVWIHIRGKSISLPYVINVGVTYIPPEGSPYAVADDFENICESIRNKSKTGPVFICGDTNSRTSDIPDYVPLHVCEDLPDLIAAQPNILYRCNVDRTVNSYGRRLIDLCKYAGLQICNGRLCASKYTCYKYNGESVVDYLLAPSNFFDIIINFQIFDKLVYSDHCALSFALSGHGHSRKNLVFKNHREKIKTYPEVKQLHERDPQGYWQFWKRHRPWTQNYDWLDPSIFTAYYKNMETKPIGELFNNQFMADIEDFIAQYKEGSVLNTNCVLDDILNAPIKLEETLASLKRMKTNKAAGTDGIPVELYKYCGDILSQPLTALFNHVMNTSSYPGAWCEGVINPLHKRESPAVPENYRNITVTPAIGKIFDGILNNRLQFAKECLGTGDPLQNGFKPGASAIDNIFILNGIIDKCNANGRPLYTCFVEFRSAFDLINRSALLFKLMNKGYTGKFLSVIQSMFQNATSRVKWGGVLGEIFENLYGVLQGGVLSPNFFNIFLEDLPDYISREKGVYISHTKIPYLLFADDLVLMSESPTGLQKLMRGLENFCSQWHMVVNVTKTKVVVFNERFASSSAHPFVFNGNEVPNSKHYNYLGVTFSNSGNRFGDYYELKYGKVLRAIYASRTLACNAIGPNIPITVLCKIFDTRIQPIIDYGSEVCYNRKSNNRLESLHLTYLKRALGVKLQTSNLAIYGETGRYPLKVRQETLITVIG